MKVAISNGHEEADYIIKIFKNHHNKLVVINDDFKICNELSKKNGIDTIFGNSTSDYDLKLAQIDDYDLFIALSNNDVINYISCKLAKQMFHIKKTIAIVKNPNIVNLFKSLGIDSTISSTYLLGETIKQEANIETMLKNLSFEDNKVSIYELLIKDNYYVCNKQLKNIVYDRQFNVSAIYRKPNVIIPKGDTVLLHGDKVFIMSASEDKDHIVELFTRKQRWITI